MRAGWVFIVYGVQLFPTDVEVPVILKLFRSLSSLFGRFKSDQPHGQRLAHALTKLGPSYIKLGQFLATRDDVIGSENARELAKLQDRLPPFSMDQARKTIFQELGRNTEEIFETFEPSVAAASIAQVHKAVLKESPETTGAGREVAVKILRPGIEQRFQKDLQSYFFAARLIENFHSGSRRLKPVAVVDTLAKSVELEMDLRMEAAAISEFSENVANDEGFRIPRVEWGLSAKRVLTLDWVDGIPITNVAELESKGMDLKRLARLVVQSFLRHAMRDGFFHADMHQGNLFVDSEENIVAVDFGIMGRLGLKERHFLAEILRGFLNRDYKRVARVHMEAGYVPLHHGEDNFAQALRAIGEPLMDKTADEISMARLLGQLFQVTEMFDMETRPELIMLQKTMVVVEGVGRSLDPNLNMWELAEPVVQEWIQLELSPDGRLQDAAEGAASLGKLVGEIPSILMRAERTAESLSDMASEGLRLDNATIEKLAREQSKQNRLARVGIWILAIALVFIAINLFILR